MTKEEIRTLTIDEVKERLQAILDEIEADDADLDALEEEQKALHDRERELRKAAIAEEEARAVAAKEVVTIKTFEEEKEERKMGNMEIRNTPEYKAAYLEYIKSGNDAECRALLTTNVSGYVPVPELLENEIKTAWESNALFDVVRKTYIKGNVKVGFELSATGASVHVEGTDAPAEEVVTIGVIELKPESLKKWITVSDESIDMNDNILDYIYKELAYRIVALAVSELIDAIKEAPTASTATAAGVQTIEAAPDVNTVVNAVALLSAQATNLNIVMNRQTKPLFVTAAMQANFAMDIWDGLEDKIIYTDALDGYTDAEAEDVYAIIGDFGYGAQANFPNGTDMSIKFDDLSLAEKDLVKIVGRMYVAIGVVAENAFVTITKPSA